ncbi:MAG: hypothetical protein ACC726_16795 [Chloroflexota bacterium]
MSNPITRAAAELQGFCEAAGWRFCFIGGIAVQRWGEPRLTQDADLTIITGFGGEATFVDELLGSFEGRLPDAREFALRNRVLLAATAEGVPVDISLGAMPFEERAVSRASDYAMAPDIIIRTCGAEDLVVMKAFAGRDQDWLDIKGIVDRQAGTLDRELVFAELDPLLDLKEDGESGHRLRTLLD